MKRCLVSRMGTGSWPSVYAALLTMLVGCGDDDRPPPASNGDGAIGIPSLPPGSGGGDGGRDGGRDGSDAGDAGQDSAALPPGCVEPGLNNQYTAQQGDAFLPVPVQSAFLTWDCSLGNLIIAISDGSCAPSVGTQLQIIVAREAINTTVTTGQNFLLEKPNDTLLSASLVFAAPTASEFGACAGSDGTVEFDAIDEVAAANVAGTFDLQLTSCDGDADPPVVVLGRFNLNLPSSFEDTCP